MSTVFLPCCAILNTQTLHSGLVPTSSNFECSVKKIFLRFKMGYRKKNAERNMYNRQSDCIW